MLLTGHMSLSSIFIDNRKISIDMCVEGVKIFIATNQFQFPFDDDLSTK